MVPLIAALVNAGLPLLANAVMAKGKDIVEEKTGIKLPDLKMGEALPPEQVVALRKVEVDRETTLRELDVREYEAETKDKQDARDLQKAALAQDDDFAKNFIYYFAMLWTVLASAYIYGITFYDVPKENVRNVDLVLGFLLGTALAGVFQFFFGSSSRSAAKDKTINQMVKQIGPSS